MNRINIDLNSRVGSLVRATYSVGRFMVGDEVLAVEPEDGVMADAVVRRVDVARCVVYLDVDWDSIRDLD